MNDFSQTETLNLATSTDERAIKYLRQLVEEGEESGYIPFNAEEILRFCTKANNDAQH